MLKGSIADVSFEREELSPWGWQAYDAEFRERMQAASPGLTSSVFEQMHQLHQAEKKLYAMNGLPDSGAEPQDRFT